MTARGVIPTSIQRVVGLQIPTRFSASQQANRLVHNVGEYPFAAHKLFFAWVANSCAENNCPVLGHLPAAKYAN